MTIQEETTALHQHWQQKIKDWASSGQSQKVFCDAHDLIYHQFGYWRRKFLERDHPVQDSGFASVRYQHPTGSSGLSLSLPNGLVLKGIAADNVGVAYQLISRLS